MPMHRIQQPNNFRYFSRIALLGVIKDIQVRALMVCVVEQVVQAS